MGIAWTWRDARPAHLERDLCAICGERPAGHVWSELGGRVRVCAECLPAGVVLLDREPAEAETALAFGARVVAPGLVARLRANLGRWLAGKTEGAL
jgi:hypothetical protein